ncbi:MAG: acyltransferase [Pseudomonadota bacterium]
MSRRATWIDALRLSAGVSMVGLHASSDATGQPFAAWDSVERIGPVLFRTIVYMARTELFIVVSLFLLIMALERRPRGYGETVVEQARRLMVPFAFWVVFYAFFRLGKAHYFGYEDAIWAQLADPVAWLGYFVLGDVSYHMHFLPTLFPLVFFYPLYRLAIRYPVMGLGILLCLALKREVDVWLWSTHKDMDGFMYLIRLVKVLTYMGYGLVAGSFYGILKRNYNDKIWRKVSWTVLCIGAVLVYIKLTHAVRMIEFGDWQFNYTPAYWADFLMPALLFAVCMAFRNKNWPEAFTKYAPYSFGIYLVHPIFLDQFEIMTDGHGWSPTLIVAAKVAGTLTCTCVAVWLIAKTRALAWTIGMGPIPAINLRPQGHQHSN